MQLEELFFKTFNIPPVTKKGERYFTSNFRFAQHRAEEDRYPTINGDVILMLEEILMRATKDTSLIVNRCQTNWFDDRVGYSYTIEERDPDEPDNYHHSIGSPANSRKDALLHILIEYSYIHDVFTDVREVFHQTERVDNLNVQILDLEKFYKENGIE